MKFHIDNLQHPDHVELNDTKRWEIWIDALDGLLVHDRQNKVLIADAITQARAMQMMELLSHSHIDTIAHGPYLQACICADHRSILGKPYRYVTFMEPVPVKVQAEGISYRKLDKSSINTVCKTYSFQELAEEAYISQRIEDGMIGAWHQDQLVGFIGIHDTGSIGMLEVIPAYRRRNIGIHLLDQMVQEQLRRGRIPYSEIFIDNEISMKLAKSHGGQISGNTMVWCPRKLS